MVAKRKIHGAELYIKVRKCDYYTLRIPHAIVCVRGYSTSSQTHGTVALSAFTLRDTIEYRYLVTPILS